MADTPPAVVQPAPPPMSLIDMVRHLSKRQNAAIRYLTPAQAKRMNVPNALVDPVMKNGKIVGASRIMYMPQGTYQALDSLTRDTGVTWPEKTQAIALMTLLHEAGHMRSLPNWQNERRQQRFALDRYMWATRKLNIDPERAARMYDHVVKYTRSLPQDYQPRRMP